MVMPFGDHIGNRIRLQDLRIFLAVVDAGSMGKAARQLNVAQPNISNSIANMERMLAVSLLDRRPQGVEPTAHGRALRDCAIVVFGDLRQGLNNISFLPDLMAGEARIGAPPFLGATIVSAVIDRLARRYPAVVFHILSLPSTDTLRGELMERRVDLLITRSFSSIADARLDFEPLFDDTFVVVVVAGARNKWARRRDLSLPIW